MSEKTEQNLCGADSYWNETEKKIGYLQHMTPPRDWDGEGGDFYL